MSPYPATTIHAELDLRLLGPDGDVSIGASLRYEAADPYAVRILFRTGGERGVEWVFARQLLTDGLTAPAGDGDVHVEPAAGRPGSVWLMLNSPGGAALFAAPHDALVEFLARTYQAVAAGAEADLIDLDAELALLLWSGAGN